MKVMSNKSLLGKNTKIQRQKQIRITLIQSVKRRNIAFEISNVKMDKN
jgi:hypothetical protein